MWTILPVLAAAVALVAPAPTPAASSTQADTKAKLTLLAEHNGAAPGGTVTLALDFAIPEHWHLYYDGQNDTGQPAKIDVSKLPAGVTVGPIQWPAPTLQVLPGDIADHVYEKRLTLLVPVTLSKDVKPGHTLKVDLPVSWMECASECRLASYTVRAEIHVVAAASDAKPTAHAKTIEAARQALPVDLPKDGIAVQVKGDTLEITAANAKKLAFYPASASTPLRNLIADSASSGGTLKAKLKINPKGDPKSVPVVGILRVTTDKGDAVYTIDTRPKSK